MDVILLGLMANQSASGGQVRLDDIANSLLTRGWEPRRDELRVEIDRLLAAHRWFGLAWTDSDRDTLAPIAGVRWFCKSAMYKKLVEKKPIYGTLTSEFAAAIQDFDTTFNTPRLLVDAGSSTFHCLFHEGCERLRKQVKKLLTNNLFVALCWQEEFNDKGDVFLIGGVPHLDTAATIENEKLDQWLGARSRSPDISLLSWHFVKPDGGSLTFYTADPKELEMKRAAMDVTTGRIYIVFDKGKIVEKVPKDAKGYALSKYLEKQAKKDRRETQGQDGALAVYIITDIEKQDIKKSGAMKDVFDVLNGPKCKEAGIHLICPANTDAER